MRTVFEIILLSFENEFKRIPNLIGWLMTVNLWVMTNIEQVNNVVTVLGGLASFVWIVIKIVLAYRQLKGGKKDDSNE